MNCLCGHNGASPVTLRITNRASVAPLVARPAVIWIEHLSTLATHEPTVLDERNASARLNRLDLDNSFLNQVFGWWAQLE